MSDAPQRPAGTTDPAAIGPADSAGTGAGGRPDPGYRRPGEDGTDGRTIAAMGGIALAAVLMILSGLVTFFVGITGIIRGSFFATVPNYTFYYSVRGRGWTDLIIGAIICGAGVCLLLGMMWARVVGVVLAVISGIANFLFLPYYPIWGVIVIALDVFIIWALVAGGRRQPA